MDPQLIACWASIIGFPITFVGLIIAIWQIRKSKSAADASKESIISFQKKLGTVDVLSNISEILQIFDEIKRLLRNTCFLPIPDRLSVARSLLIKTRESQTELFKNKNKIFQEIISELQILEKKLDVDIVEKTGKLNIPEINERINIFIDNLNGISSEVKKSIGKEGKNGPT
jgi:hypothetical protein